MGIGAGAAVTSADRFYVGNASGTSGTVTQTGGSVSLTTGGISVGYSGSGTYNISGGSLTYSGHINGRRMASRALTGVGVLNVSGSVPHRQYAHRGTTTAPSAALSLSGNLAPVSSTSVAAR